MSYLPLLTCGSVAERHYRRRLGSSKVFDVVSYDRRTPQVAPKLLLLRA